MKKKEQNALRLRYVRALERFSKSVLAYLAKSTDLTQEGYIKKVKNGLKLLDRIEPVHLYKGELRDLESLVERMKAYAYDDSKEIEEIKKELLHSANQLEKSKNFKKYKKPKHSKSDMEEWE